MYYIYGLIDPITKQLRYIGQTNNIKNRYRSHYWPGALKYNTHKNHWLKKLLKDNLKAEIIIMEEYIFEDELDQAEIDAIEYYKSIGCNLTNCTEGGMRGPTGKGNKNNFYGKKHSEETKKKWSLTRIGRPSSKKIQFTEEQIKSILSDNRFLKEIGKDYNCSLDVIWRLKRSYK